MESIETKKAEPMIASPQIMTITSSIPCEYFRWDNDLHVFCFTLPSREAVDLWLERLKTIHQQNGGAPVLQLLDIRPSGMLPMTYVFNKLQTWFPAYQGNPAVYSAVLHNDSASTSMVQPFMRLLGSAYKFHFFGAHAQESAISWLLNQQINAKVS
jgi:hypothetical protein